MRNHEVVEKYSNILFLKKNEIGKERKKDLKTSF
jgi:hypothetical protein